MEVASQKKLEVEHHLESLSSELQWWRDESVEGAQYEKQNSQIMRVTKQLIGLQKSLGTPGESLASNAQLQSKILRLYRIWEFFRSKFAARSVDGLADDLACADDLAWACFQPARDAAVDAGTTTAEEAKAPPLVFFSGDDSPFMQPRDTRFLPMGFGNDIPDLNFARVLLKLPIPLIGLPWHHLKHLPSAPVIAHEVGHVVEADCGLTDDLAEILADLDLPSCRAEGWQTWMGEIMADVWGVLGVGRAYVHALMAYLAGDPDHVKQEVQQEGTWEAHPPTVLRMRINIEVLRQLLPEMPSPDRREEHRNVVLMTDAVDHLDEAWDKAYSSHAMADFEDDVKPLVAALLSKPFGGLGGSTLGSVLRFGPSDEKKARDLSNKILRGHQLPEAEPVQRLFAAATLAYSTNPTKYKQMEADDSIASKIVAARPKGVRSKVGEDVAEFEARQERADLEAGKALLDLL